MRALSSEAEGKRGGLPGEPHGRLPVQDVAAAHRGGHSVLQQFGEVRVHVVIVIVPGFERIGRPGLSRASLWQRIDQPAGGSRTASITWMTPLEASTSAWITCASG